ncbi:ABC transporter permease [Roseomonas gilardii subsp. gilardii]|uniref:ABC transporter permease n=1 Tax=Roseomonas gilardii TaxID=257708 RepID=UPI001FFB4E6A|nr:ABC transporter permease [Roseomonas gilardii]UPG73361.1 ABC transporter permease [Roseomonas gilardii subsp. gilardii]
MSRNGPLALAFHGLFIAFILAPLVVVVLVSFTDKGFMAMPFDGASLRWYRAIAGNPQFLDSFWVSLRLGLVSATLSALIAVPAALAIARGRFPGRDAIAAFLVSPLMIPHVVLGVALLRFFSGLGLAGSFAGLVAAHLIVVTPYMVRLVTAGLAGLDPRVERAAESLGAGRATVFRRITLPLILPGVAGGWILAFITSFDELTVSLFLASPSSTPLPVRLFTYIDQMTDPLVAAVSAALIGLTALVLVVLDRFYPIDRLLTGSAGDAGRDVRRRAVPGARLRLSPGPPIRQEPGQTYTFDPGPSVRWLSLWPDRAEG